MKPQEYIIETLKTLAKPVQFVDIGKTPVEEAIYAKVMSKKFRKVKADEGAISITKKAIHLAVARNEPVKINLIFGGNKLWHFEEAPEIDWAELFTVIYLSRWMKSIASVFKPGVYLEFYSEDVVLESMNNLPKAETDKYTKSFKSMLTWFDQFLPKGVTIGYKRYGDEYHDVSEYLAELEDAKVKVLKELGGKLPVLSEEQKAATEMNVRLTPGQSDDSEWREKAELIHQSIERTKTMERYIGDTSFIPSCPTYFQGCIATGSTKKSYAKFWVAVGALEHSKEGYNEIVLTPKQLATTKFMWEKVNIPGLNGKNFQKIRVID